MTALFTEASEATAPEATNTELEALKQKFKDQDALAKGKLEADKHIKNLEQELGDLRKELDTRLNYEQFLDEIKSSRATSSPVNQTAAKEPVNNVVNRDEIERLVKETLTAERSNTQKERNTAIVVDTLQKNWGSNYQDRLAQKAREIEMSPAELTRIAETNPKGFFKLVDAQVPVQEVTPSVAPPSNQIRRDAGPINTGVRNAKYYSELRKKSPAHYHSVAVQKQMHDDVFALGEDFYQ